MNRWLLFSLIVFAFLIGLAPKFIFASIEINEEIIKQINAEIEQNMVTHGIPGMAFALVNREGVIHSKGFGVLDVRDPSSKVDEHTNFPLGSLSKVFTSVAIIQLQEQNVLNVNDPVVTYLPWFETKNREDSNKITIEHLLNHSSGLPGRLNVHDIKSLEREDIVEGIASKLQNVKLVGEPGEIYEYTNMNTDLLQLIIEEVTGEKFTHYMEKNIFVPLQMDRTDYFTHHEQQLENTAMGHRYHWGKLKPYEEQLVYATAASAGLTSNIDDLATFMISLLNDEGSLNEMFAPNCFGLGYN